jgi:anti-sigma regulatory factor (Ser/Thr protein kinase)
MDEQGVFEMDAQTHAVVPRTGAGAPSRINVEFESGPSAAAWARNCLLVLNPRLEPPVMEDVRLLVSELVTNSVRHSDMASSDPVQLDVSVSSRTVRVEVCDSGGGFEPHPRAPDETRAGGWGLLLVDKLSDRWGVASNTLTRVWFEIDLGGTRVL